MTNISDLKSASLHGLKKYNFDNHLIYASSIQIDNARSNTAKIFSMIDYLMDYVIDNDIEIFAFIVPLFVTDKSTFCIFTSIITSIYKLLYI